MPVFQTAAENAPFDTPTGPVKSQFGYHVILVTHAEPSYAGVATPRCSARSCSRARPTAQKAIDALLKAFKVHVDPRFGTWGHTPNGQGQNVYEVTPPSKPTPSDRRARAPRPCRPPPRPRARRAERRSLHGSCRRSRASSWSGSVRPAPISCSPRPGPRSNASRRGSCARRAIPRSTISPRDGIVLEPLDLLYDRADDLDTVYAAIADRVVETARERGEIVYAVPGSPTIAERSVELVRAAGIDVELIPGISFVDLAWWRLGIDPMHGARVVDGRAFAIDAAGSTGPMLIAQCDSQLVLLRGEARAARVAARRPRGHRAPAARVARRAACSRSRSPTSTATSSPTTSRRCSSTPGAPVWARSWRGCSRSPSGCAVPAAVPWDAAQTHHTLRRHVLEEAYEVVEAIEQLPADAPAGDIPIGAYDALEDELGDLLFQVMIQSVLASEAGAFTVADVARAVHEKLVRRHPHVFGDVRVNDASEVVTNWEQIKKAEKDDTSLVAGVTAGLPR